MFSNLFKCLCVFVSLMVSGLAFSQSNQTTTSTSKKVQMNVSDIDFSGVDESVKKDLELKGGLSLNIYYEGSSAKTLFKKSWQDASNVITLSLKEGSNIIVELWVWNSEAVADKKVAGTSYTVESSEVKEAEVEVPLDEEGKLGSISLKLNFNEQAVEYQNSVKVTDSTNQFIQQQTQNTQDGSLVYVYIYTDNCPWCVRLKPEIQKLKQFLMSTRLGNVYQTRYVGQREYVSLGIRSFPTVLVYRNGTLIDRIVGYRTWEVLRTNAVDNVNK